MGVGAEIPQEGRGGSPCHLTRVTRFSPKPGLSVSKDNAPDFQEPHLPCPTLENGALGEGAAHTPGPPRLPLSPGEHASEGPVTREGDILRTQNVERGPSTLPGRRSVQRRALSSTQRAFLPIPASAVPTGREGQGPCVA